MFCSPRCAQLELMILASYKTTNDTYTVSKLPALPDLLRADVTGQKILSFRFIRLTLLQVTNMEQSILTAVTLLLSPIHMQLCGLIRSTCLHRRPSLSNFHTPQNTQLALCHLELLYRHQRHLRNLVLLWSYLLRVRSHTGKQFLARLLWT